MAPWREIDRLRRDANGARELAKRLLKLYPGQLTDWELDFLASLTSYTELFEFSTRQAEKLLEIRDDAEPVTKYRGFDVRTLIQRCHEARLDLAEPDEQWISDVRAQGGSSVKRRQIGRLMRCARELSLIDDL